MKINMTTLDLIDCATILTRLIEDALNWENIAKSAGCDTKHAALAHAKDRRDLAEKLRIEIESNQGDFHEQT